MTRSTKQRSARVALAQRSAFSCHFVPFIGYAECGCESCGPFGGNMMPILATALEVSHLCFP